MTSIDLIDLDIAVHYELPFEIHELGTREELLRLRRRVAEQSVEIEALYARDGEGPDVDLYDETWIPEKDEDDN